MAMSHPTWVQGAEQGPGRAAVLFIAEPTL